MVYLALVLDVIPGLYGIPLCVVVIGCCLSASINTILFIEEPQGRPGGLGEGSRARGSPIAVSRSTGCSGNSNLCAMLMVSLCHGITYIPQISHDGLRDSVVLDQFVGRSEITLVIFMATSEAGPLET